MSRPEKRNREVRLLLINGMEIEGKCRGTDKFQQAGIESQLILIKVNHTIKQIPESKIAYTQITPDKKTLATPGLLLGMAMDAAIWILVGMSSFEPTLFSGGF